MCVSTNERIDPGKKGVRLSLSDPLTIFNARKNKNITMNLALFFFFLLMLPQLASSLSSSPSTNGDVRLYGVNYSLRQGPDWAPPEERCKGAAQAQSELAQIKNALSDNVRVFSLTDCDTAAALLPLTQQLGLGLWLGMWVGENRNNFAEERARLAELLADPAISFGNVLGIHVSSESIYREELTLADVTELRNTIKSDLVAAGLVNTPVTIAEIIDNYIAYPDLIQVDDSAVTVNQFPFWERTVVDINTSAQYMSDRFDFVDQRRNGRTIIVAETGWADAGSDEDANVASPASMAKWLRDFVCLANARGWQYFWFNSHDSDWRRVQEARPDGVEGHFGIFDENGNMKSYIADLIIDCTQDRTNIDPNAPVTPRPNVPTAPVASPTSAPPPTDATDAPVPEPTLSPIATTSAPMADAPGADDPTDSPTTSPADQELTPALATVDQPSPSPVETPPTTSSPVNDSPEDASQCEVNNACNNLGLKGECCPTIDDWTLDCCNGGDGGGGGSTVEELCADNLECAALDLADACCPTIEGWFLDCCESVPNDCQGPGACEVYSAVEYAALRAPSSAATANAGSNNVHFLLPMAAVYTLLVGRML